VTESGAEPASAASLPSEHASGPSQGTYDADRVASSARQADPGLPQETAVRLARDAWRHLREAGVTDPAEIARRLLADHRADGATAANVVAVAAVQFCAVHDVDPTA
jgi:hypothetical protein